MATPVRHSLVDEVLVNTGFPDSRIPRPRKGSMSEVKRNTQLAAKRY